MSSFSPVTTAGSPSPTTTWTDASGQVVDRSAWLAERRNSVGASEAAAVLGLSPYDTPLSLYLRKLGKIPEPEETLRLRMGNLLEPTIAQLYVEQTGETIEATQVFGRHPELPFVTATMDLRPATPRKAVECKTMEVFARHKLGEEGTDDLPEHWLVQAHQQMAVFDLDQIDFAVLVGFDSFRVFHVHRDEGLLQCVLEGVENFWRLHVVPRNPPRASAMDAEVLKHLRPTPGVTVSLDGYADDQAQQYLKLGEQIKVLEETRDGHKARLMQLLGDAEEGFTPSGLRIARKVVIKPEKLVKGTSYTTFSVRKPPKSKKGRSDA